MEIFWRLMLGHFIGDFTLQTNYIAAWKRRNLWGLLVHCGIHPLIYAALLWKYLDQVWLEVGSYPLTGFACLLIIFVTHVIEDEWRIWSVLKRNAPDNTFFYVWDQVIHYAVIFTFSPVVEGGTSKFPFLSFPKIAGVIPLAQAAGLSVWERFLTITQPEPWVFVGMLFVIVTHFTTVSIYFLEKDFYGTEFPDAHEKYIAMAERILVMVCLLLPGKWWMSVVLLWLLRTVLYKNFRLYDGTWINILLGNGTALVCGAIARFFLYFRPVP